MDGTNFFDLITEKGNHQAHHQTDTESRNEVQEDSIIAFIGKLSFNLSDSNKKVFLSELEAILADTSEENFEDNPALYKFFVKYAV